MTKPTDQQIMDLLWDWIQWKETGEIRPVLKYFIGESKKEDCLDFTDPYYRAHKK